MQRNSPLPADNYSGGTWRTTCRCCAFPAVMPTLTGTGGHIFCSTALVGTQDAAACLLLFTVSYGQPPHRVYTVLFLRPASSRLYVRWVTATPLLLRVLFVCSEHCLPHLILLPPHLHWRHTVHFCRRCLWFQRAFCYSPAHIIPSSPTARTRPGRGTYGYSTPQTYQFKAPGTRPVLYGLPLWFMFLLPHVNATPTFDRVVGRCTAHLFRAVWLDWTPRC